jgi:hypothetical protein
LLQKLAGVELGELLAFGDAIIDVGIHFERDAGQLAADGHLRDRLQRAVGRHGHGQRAARHRLRVVARRCRGLLAPDPPPAGGQRGGRQQQGQRDRRPSVAGSRLGAGVEQGGELADRLLTERIAPDPALRRQLITHLARKKGLTLDGDATELLAIRSSRWTEATLDDTVTAWVVRTSVVIPAGGRLTTELPLTLPDARLADVLLHPDTGYWAGWSRAYRERLIATGEAAVHAQAARVIALHAGDESALHLRRPRP